MRTATRVALLSMSLIVTACASTDPIIVQPGRTSSGAYGRNDPLQSTARDANSVESIVTSIARIGRLAAGGY